MDDLKNAIQETERSIEQWKTAALIHTFAFITFIIVSLFVPIPWIFLTLALTIWNGWKASSCWNNVAILKSINNGNEEVVSELQRIHNHWYNADGTMKQERINEALERLNKENNKND